MRTILILLLAGVAALALGAAAPPAPTLVAQRVTLASGQSFSLEILAGYTLAVAAEGLGRCRFPALSPDGRVFVGDMVNLADNSRGSVYVLEGFDPQARRFRKVTKYLTGLRNPNGVAFATDKAGRTFFYLATTEKLVRYPYRAGDLAPSGPDEVLATFPDYGLSYKYGGWHLTRSLAVTTDDRLLVAVGSSCNACVEKEPVRASILEMDLDGKNARPYATGLRNAVGLAWVKDRLFATNQGSDHLGPNLPEETLYAVEPGKHYGWPYAYQAGGKVHADPGLNAGEAKLRTAAVPLAWATFPAHGSALGLAFFDGGTKGDADPRLAGRFLVALHGSSKRSLKRGYQVVIAGKGEKPAPFLRGFLKDGKVNGRPCGILRLDDRSFLVTDDHAGVIYHVRRE